MSDKEQEFIKEAHLFLDELKKANAVHVCSKEDFLNKVDFVLFGNIPANKKGMFVMFDEFIQDHKIIVDSIAEIKEGVAGLHRRADENKDAAQKVANALTEYKKETRAFEKGGSTVEERLKITKELKAKTRQEKWQRWIWIITGILLLIGTIVSVYSLWFRIPKKMDASQEETNHRIDVTKGIPNLTRGYLHFNNNGIMDSVKILNVPKNVLK